MKGISLLIAIILLLTSCDEGGLLIETDITDETVVLLAPSNNAEVIEGVINFNWEVVEDASGYEIQVALPDFETTQQLFLNSVDSIPSASTELSSGQYEWRVRALNNNSSTSYSTARFLVVPVVNFSDNTVSLISPENDLITNVVTQNLEWQEVDGASLYRIQVLENSTILQEETSTTTNFSLDFPEGTLIWQVRAEKGIENTQYTSRDILLDVTPPNTPILSAPKDEAILIDTLVSFEWSREVLQGSEEKDSISIYRDITLTDLVVEEIATPPFSQSLTEGTYYWQVKSFDEAGNIGTASSVFSFTIDIP
jgi:hypothetical protein|tara:strand:+ start:27836 stop:28768 length:933 start_codon:yes stop_codon:yes gene_type:complete